MASLPESPAIAVVEDEYIVALDIKNFLERSGYRVSGLFPSGDELLARMDELGPDLVLMDIKIRGSLDGVETAKIVHDRWKTPVILLTAFADDETIARAKLTQPFAYILKPFEERELRTSIEIALYRAGMERRLRDSEERFRRLFQEGISGNFLADAQDRVIEANAAFRRLIGLEADAPLPRLREIFHDSASWESFKAGLARSRRVEAAELALRKPGGGELIVLANAALLTDGDGNAAGIQGEFSDLTDRRVLEERLGQSQKMEAVGRLAGGVAHDFNNILTAVLGYANLLSESAEKYPELKDDVEGIRKAAAKAAALTRQLLAFSRQQPVAPKNLALNALVGDMERMLRRLLTEEISLSFDLGEGLPEIFADPTHVEQVVVNLVVNAKDAMPGGGRLLVSTRLESLAAPRAVGLETLAPGRYAALSVRDSGGGIASEILPRIFEPFFTTKARDKGTGLGLSTVYGIAKQAGGAVGVSSASGEGSTFTVYFPETRRPQAGAAGGPASSSEDQREALARRPGTILFVDDDEEIRLLAGKFLGRRGHRVLVAANAGEAILLAESGGSPIELLVTDLVMPIMDGYRLARRLAGAIPGLKVIFISGHPERATDKAADGASGKAAAGSPPGRFLPKPFTEQELSEAVDEALAEPS